MKEKQLVESIFQEKAKSDSNSRDLANMLNVLTKTVFGEVNRFVFELLQNADDAPNNPGVADVDVEFRLVGNYLIFKHTGKHFTENDVKGISGIGNRASEKDKDADKTGYKGIGFKSVFNSSESVHILSNKYSFRFDKNYQMWKGSTDYPWQVIPIWTEEIPVELKNIIDVRMVNTIISISKQVDVRKELLELFQDCQIVLFLRSVRNISVFIENEAIIHIEKKLLDGGVRQLFKNGKVHSSWIVKDFVLPVSEELKLKLTSLSETECPQKLKDADSAKISFAALVEGDKLHTIDDAVIYCYLPTKVSKGFPYLINADFITNAERTSFLSNDWNAFLFSEIAVKQLEWLKELGGGLYQYQITKLIRRPFVANALSGIEKAYNTSFSSALKSIAFIPQDTEGKPLLKISEAIVDQTEIINLYTEPLITGFLRNGNHVVTPRLQHNSVLLDLGAVGFTIENLFALFEAENFRVDVTDLPAEIIRLITFFRNQTSALKFPTWMQLLKDMKFLIDQHGKFQSPKNLYFPLREDQKETLDFTDLFTLHEQVYKHFENNETIKWLHDLGIKEPSALEIVRKSISKMISENRVDVTNAVPVGKFIFKVFQSGELSDNDISFLKGLKLVTSNGLKSSSDSYLGGRYKPKLPIDSILPEANFVLDAYCEDESQLDDWRKFLISLGVKNNVEIVTFPNRHPRNTLINTFPKYQQYFSWLDSEEHYPNLYRPWPEQHSVTDFSTLDLIEYTNQYSFSKVFWKMVLENWEAFYQRCNVVVYHRKNGSDVVPSYVRYFVQNHSSIPATDGRCYSGRQLYAPQLKGLVQDYFPVADFDSKLNKEHIEFYGFKIELSVSDCCTILSSLEAKTVDGDIIKQEFAVYEQLIKLSSNMSMQDVTILKTWCGTGRLLALDNTFQSVPYLSCFSDGKFTAPVSSPHFLKLPRDLKKVEVEALCSILDMRLVTSEKLEFVPQKPVDDKGLTALLLSRSKYFAIILAQNSSTDVSSSRADLFKLISSTKFFSAESLSLVYKDESGSIIFSTSIETWHNRNGEFYYIGKWNSPLTLYSLGTSLSEFLKIKDAEREIGLILQLEETDIERWLLDKGYVIPSTWSDTVELTFPEEVVQLHPNENEVESHPTSDESFTLEVSEFVPEINVEDLDFDKVEGIKKSTNSITTIVSPTSYAAPSTKSSVDIGRWSEKFMFEYFKSRTDIYKDVVWNNEREESYLDHDITLTENGTARLIEVKGTPSSSKEVFPISLNEWKLMFSIGDKYSIYRVFNAGKPNANYIAIDNPADMIAKGEMIPTPINLQF